MTLQEFNFDLEEMLRNQDALEKLDLIEEGQGRDGHSYMTLQTAAKSQKDAAEFKIMLQVLF